MGLFPDILPSILRQDACEIVAVPKHDSQPPADYWARVSVGGREKSIVKTAPAVELDRIKIDKKAPRKDPIFAVHEKNLALAASNSILTEPINRPSYVDKTICLLLDNLNAARREVDIEPLVLNPELCEHADFHAANLTRSPALAFPGPAYKKIRARHLGILKDNTKVERVIFAGRGLLHGARHGIRLTSAEGLGALACSELWLSGKYKKHVYPIRSSSDHPPDCACAEWAAYKVVMDSERHLVGVARDPSGRWVVEFLDVEEW